MQGRSRCILELVYNDVGSRPGLPCTTPSWSFFAPILVPFVDKRRVDGYNPRRREILCARQGHNRDGLQCGFRSSCAPHCSVSARPHRNPFGPHQNIRSILLDIRCGSSTRTVSAGLKKSRARRISSSLRRVALGAARDRLPPTRSGLPRAGEAAPCATAGCGSPHRNSGRTTHPCR